MSVLWYGATCITLQFLQRGQRVSLTNLIHTVSHTHKANVSLLLAIINCNFRAARVAKEAKDNLILPALVS